MHWSEHFVRDHKRQTDCAIHRACAELAADPSALDAFHELLLRARMRAPRLFEAPVVTGHHLGVEALVHLSRFRDAHIRPLAGWAGVTSSWRPAVASLAHHLLCKYTVPAFLASSWYSPGWVGDRKRRWFIAHARGASFRSLDLPIAMTRKMEHLFLTSPDHLPFEHAIRRAELLALGAPAEFVEAILATRLANDLRHGEFWRTVWLFLIANAHDMDAAQIGPMIDYIQAIRHDRIPVDRPEGRVEIDPPQPHFSIKGRTAQSMQRLMREWHRNLGVAGGPVFSWARSTLHPMLIEEPEADSSQNSPGPPKRWQLTELTDSGQLRVEGAALHHCVASYASGCYRGTSSIWSLRVWRGEKMRHVLTVEVDPRRRAVVQARGRANRMANGKPLRLVRDWAGRERLRLMI